MIREFKIRIDWLLLFIILVPTYWAFGFETRSTQMQFFTTMGIILVGLMHINKYMGGFLLYVLFQIHFLSRNPNDDLEGLHLYNLLMACVIYHFIAFFFKTENSKKYLWAFWGIMALNIVWCFLQKYQQDPIWRMMDFDKQQTFSEFSGFFCLPAFLGNYAAAVLPICFLLSPFIFPVCLIGLFFSKSTFSVIAALAAVLFFFWFKKRIVFWIVLVAGVTSLLFYGIKYDMPTGQFERRLKVWKLIATNSFSKQWFGHGFSMYKNTMYGEITPTGEVKLVRNPEELKGFIIEEAKKLNKTEVVDYVSKLPQNQINISDTANFLQKNNMDFHPWANAHNEFLETFFDVGAVGMIFVFGYIFDMFKRFFNYGTKNILCITLISSFIAILIVSLGHFPFHLARLAAPYIVIMAMLEAALLKASKKVEVAF